MCVWCAGMEQCQMSGARYTRCLFLLSQTLLYLAEKRFNEANPLLQQVSSALKPSPTAGKIFISSSKPSPTAGQLWS